MKIRITEEQLKEIIAKTLNESMDEWQTIMRFPQGFVSKKGEDWKRDRISKEAERNPKLDPAGFQWFGDELRHNEKKAVRRAAPYVKREITPKPENMGDEEYYEKMVLPQNDKIRTEAEKYNDEEWRPIINGGRYFGGEADYGCDYEVSNRARLKVLNHSNVMKSMIYDPYPAPTKKAMQFHLNGFDSEGNAQKTCPSVAYMVANAFLGEHNPKEWKVVHLDGNWRNNVADNLKWVRKRQ